MVVVTISIFGTQLILMHDVFIVANVSMSDGDEPCSLTVGIMARLTVPPTQDEYLFAMYTLGMNTTITKPGIASFTTEPPDRGSPIFEAMQGSSTSTYWRDPTISCPNHGRFAGAIALDLSENQDPALNDLSGISSSLGLYICSGQCSQGTAQVTVNGIAQAVVGLKYFADEHVFRDDEFNVTTFEAFLEIGRVRPEHVFSIDLLEPGLWTISHTQSLSDVVISSLTSQDNRLSSYLELATDDRVGEAFEPGYRLIYALMYSAFLRLPAEGDTITGSVHVEAFSVVVVPAFAIISEALLGLASVELIALILRYHRRKSILRSDPDSIAAQCSIIVDEFSDIGIMGSAARNLELLSTEQLAKELKESHLNYSEVSGHIELVTPQQQMISLSATPAPASHSAAISQDPLPFFMTRIGVTLIVVTISVVLGAMIFLLAWSRIQQGFDFLTDSLSFRARLFWSFLPTLIATCFEMNLVSIHRDLCVLETWVAIRRQHTYAKDSLSLRYSSRPPSLVLWMAFTRRHFMLCFVSSLCITTGILNIAMAGLFLVSEEDLTSTVDAVSQFTTTELPGSWMNRYDIDQAFSVLRAELSDDGTLPPWTDHDFSFIPVSTDQSTLGSAFVGDEVYSAVTSALGSQLECEDLSGKVADSSSGPGIYKDNEGAESVRFKAGYLDPSTNQTCTTAYDVTGDRQSIYFKPMDLLDLNNISMYSPGFGDCKNTLLLVAVESASGPISMYACTLSISVVNIAIKYATNQSILSHDEEVDTESGGAATIRNETDLLAFYGLEFGRAATLSHATGQSTEYDWPGLLITRLPDVPASSSIAVTAAILWRRTFAIWFSLYRDELLVARNDGDASSLPKMAR